MDFLSLFGGGAGGGGGGGGGGGKTTSSSAAATGATSSGAIGLVGSDLIWAIGIAVAGAVLGGLLLAVILKK